MRLVVQFAVLAILTAAAQPVLAGPSPAPPSLAGEEFLTTAGSVTSANCNPTGTSTFTYTASGVATGPYPGPFSESGSVALGPQFRTIGGFTGFQGFVTGFSAVFTINSPLGQVSGVKTLPPGGIALTGECGTLVPLFGVGEAQEASVFAVYRATIRQPQVSSDSGTSTLTVFQIGPSAQFLFREDFISSRGVAPGNSGTLKPGEGCGDVNHVHEVVGQCP